MNKDFLQELRPGDLVIVSYGGGQESITKVERTTKTLIRTKNLRFRKSDGFMTGGSTWNIVNIKEATEENLKNTRHKNEYKNLPDKLYSTDWHRFSLEELRKIAQLLKP